MKTAEIIELALIPVAGAFVWWLAGRLPDQISIGSLLLAASVLLLLQGLLRDLWILAQRREHSPSGPRTEALCMCVESTVGVTGVVAGLVILGSAADATLSVSQLLACLLTVTVLAIGFAIKDFVFEWRPFRIRRDKDHVNIVFSWKR